METFQAFTSPNTESFVMVSEFDFHQKLTSKDAKITALKKQNNELVGQTEDLTRKLSDMTIMKSKAEHLCRQYKTEMETSQQKF